MQTEARPLPGRDTYHDDKVQSALGAVRYETETAFGNRHFESPVILARSGAGLGPRSTR